METHIYLLRLNLKELFDWTRDMENLFDMEKIKDPNRVNWITLS